MKMLKPKFFFIFLAIACILVVFTSLVLCIITNKQSSDASSFTPKYNFGIIETTSIDNQSYITLYDAYFKKSGSQKIPYGSMGSPFDTPQVSENNMYVVPMGIGSKNDLDFVLEYCMGTGKYSKYTMKETGLLGFVLDNSFVYSISNLNFTSKLVRCDKKSKKLKSLEFKNQIILKMDLHDKKIYCFGYTSSKKPILNIVDTEKFEISDTLDISSCGSAQKSSFKIGDDIYFTNSASVPVNEQEGPGKTLSKYNTKDKSIKNIELNKEYPLQILQFQDKLLITHCDLVARQGSSLTIFDPKTEQKQEIELKNPPYQSQIYKNKLYCMGDDKMFVYNLENLKFDLINSYDIKTKKEDGFYLSSFFINNKE